jgi:glutathione peroxidase
MMPTDRRRVLTFLTGSFATPAFFATPLFAQAPVMTRITAYAFSFAGLEGSEIKLADYAGKPILVVNTASLCGYTPQYAGLQQLWTRYHGRGLMIVGVPSNDFGGQEPGGAADIMRTAHGEYGIGFPLAAKAQVKGPNPHPFYKWAASERPLETPRWNFHKIPRRPRRPHRRGFRHRHRADGRPRHRRDREGVAAAGIKRRCER